MENNQLKGITYVATAAFFWGFLAIALKVADTSVDPVSIVWFRFTIAFSFLAAWHVIKRPKELRILIKPPKLLVVAASALALNYLGFMQGIHYTTPSNTQLIIQLGPITLAIFGIFVFKEKLQLSQIMGFGVAAVGFIIFYRQQLASFSLGSEVYHTGVLWVVVSALAWATYGVLQKKMVVNYRGSSLNLFLYGFPMLLYTPFVDFNTIINLDLMEWALMVYLGINTLVAYGCLAEAFKHLEANKVSIIITLNPMITFVVMGILTAMEVSWIAPEAFSVLGITGAMLVLAGAVMVVGKRKKHKITPQQIQPKSS